MPIFFVANCKKTFLVQILAKMYRRFNRPPPFSRRGEEGGSSRSMLKNTIVAVIVIALIVGAGVQIQKYVSCNKTGSSVTCGNGTTAVGSECVQINFVERCGDGLTELSGLCIKVPTLPILPAPPTPAPPTPPSLPPTLPILPAPPTPAPPAPPSLPPIQPIPVPPPTLPDSTGGWVPDANENEIVQSDPPAEEVVDPTDSQDESARPNGAPTNNGDKIAAGVIVPIILLVVAGIGLWIVFRRNPHGDGSRSDDQIHRGVGGTQGNFHPARTPQQSWFQKTFSNRREQPPEPEKRSDHPSFNEGRGGMQGNFRPESVPRHNPHFKGWEVDSDGNGIDNTPQSGSQAKSLGGRMWQGLSSLRSRSAPEWRRLSDGSGTESTARQSSRRSDLSI